MSLLLVPTPSPSRSRLSLTPSSSLVNQTWETGSANTPMTNVRVVVRVRPNFLSHVTGHVSGACRDTCPHRESKETEREKRSGNLWESMRTNGKEKKEEEEERERKNEESVVESWSKTEMKVGGKRFGFDQVYMMDTTQEVMFRTSGVTSIIDSAVDGYATTIFAYGQTGSGKTFSMSGGEDNLIHGKLNPTTDGIMPRAAVYLFDLMSNKMKTSKNNLKISCRASFAEIYNEQVKDLLNPKSGNLMVRWNPETGFFVENQIIVECTTLDDLIAVLAEGHRNKSMGSHALNSDSSRSHCLLSIQITSEIIDPEDGHSSLQFGKLTFVDLAGSERLKESKSVGDALKETANINKSLFVLGKVISALCDNSIGKKEKILNQHIPYRDSILTKLLMDSLGGNGLTLMIACCSPALIYLDETLSTLHYASRARNIKNKPVLLIDSKEKLIIQLRQEIRLLKMENALLRNGNAPDNFPVNVVNDVARGAYSFSQARSPSGRTKSEALLFPSKTELANTPYEEKSTNQAFPASPARSKRENDFISELKESMKNLKMELTRANSSKELAERQDRAVMAENEMLHSKLVNLENVFDSNQSSFSERSRLAHIIKASDLTLSLNALPKVKTPRSSLLQFAKSNDEFSELKNENAKLWEESQARIRDNEQLQARIDHLESLISRTAKIRLSLAPKLQLSPRSLSASSGPPLPKSQFNFEQQGASPLSARRVSSAAFAGKLQLSEELELIIPNSSLQRNSSLSSPVIDTRIGSMGSMLAGAVVQLKSPTSHSRRESRLPSQANAFNIALQDV